MKRALPKVIGFSESHAPTILTSTARPVTLRIHHVPGVREQVRTPRAPPGNKSVSSFVVDGAWARSLKLR